MVVTLMLPFFNVKSRSHYSSLKLGSALPPQFNCHFHISSTT